MFLGQAEVGQVGAYLLHGLVLRAVLAGVAVVDDVLDKDVRSECRVTLPGRAGSRQPDGAEWFLQEAHVEGLE